MQVLYLASGNPHKAEEFKEIARCLELVDFEIKSMTEAGIFDSIEETADSLEGNAAIKARYLYEKYGYSCFADDTGLEVESLGGEPGVYSARYAGEGVDFSANIEKLLKNLHGKSNRNARFRTVICLVLDGVEYYFEGKIEGKITEKPSGNKGFGYDAIFIPYGYTQSFAELSPQTKNSISHRGEAARKLIKFLKER